MYITGVFLETSKPFCCHWSCSNRGCLSMQCSGDGCQGGISSQQLTQVQWAHWTLLQCWACMVLASEAALLGHPVLTPGNAFESGTYLGWDFTERSYQRKRLEDLARLLPEVSQCLALSPQSLALKSTLYQTMPLNCTGFYFHIKLGRPKCLCDSAKEKTYLRVLFNISRLNLQCRIKDTTSPVLKYPKRTDLSPKLVCGSLVKPHCYSRLTLWRGGQDPQLPTSSVLGSPCPCLFLWACCMSFHGAQCHKSASF